MIDAATPKQVRDVAFRMRERDFAEFSATSFCDTREILADDLATRYGGRHDVMCATHKGTPVCIGGTVMTWPGVITLLMFATPQFRKVGLEVTRFIRHQLFPRYDAAGVHRIQAISLEGYSEVHDWLEALGLRREGELRRFGRNGEDFVQFARLADAG